MSRRASRVMAGTELTIYIVEDSPAVMERLVEAVGDIPNAKVVGSADAVAAALEGMQRSQPRVLILDIQLRGGSGFQVLKHLRASASRPEAVIVVTNHPSDDYGIASSESRARPF